MVSNNAIFYPMLALFLWTFLVMLRSVQLRVESVRKGHLSNKYYQLFLGGQPSTAILKTGNNYSNLLEMPPLFYVVAVLILVTQRTDIVFVALAWAYVGLRISHSVVHLTTNYVPLRFAFFLVSNFVLLALWIRLAWVL